MQVLPFNKAAAIISPPAVIGNINCMVYTCLLSPNKDTEKKFSLQQKHHLDVHFYKGNNCQAKSMIVLPGVK